MKPVLAETYGWTLRHVTFAFDKIWVFVIFAGFSCEIGYVTILRIMTDELTLFSFLLYVVMSLSGCLVAFAQVACFDRVFPQGVCLTFRIPCKCFPDRGAPS